MSRDMKMSNVFQRINCMAKKINNEYSENPQIDGSGSSSENENQENKKQISPLNITNYSSDDGTTSNENSFQLRMPAYKKRHKCSEKPLPLVAIKRKPPSAIDESPRKVLAVMNTKDANTSMWQKLHTEFTVVDARKTLLQISHNDKELAAIDADDEQDNSSETHIDECSSPDNNSPSGSQQICNSAQNSVPSELDLLLALIERENMAATAATQHTQSQRKKRKERYEKGSYVDLLMRTIETAHMEAHYLEHDKKFGIQVGVQLKVLSLQTSFGVHLAGVRELTPQHQQKWKQYSDNSVSLILDDSQKTGQIPDQADISYYVVLSTNMACNVKVGSKLEAFFSDEHSYWLTNANGKKQQYYIQPHKLLLLS